MQTTTGRSAPRAGIALTGAITGTATVTLCAGGIGSIAVTVSGDPQTYHGSISTTSFGFVGPEGADYALKGGEPRPSARAGAGTFTVHDAELTDLVSGRTITATGTVRCP